MTVLLIFFVRSAVIISDYYLTKLNSLGHFICVHYISYCPQRDSNPLLSGSASTTPPMSNLDATYICTNSNYV